MADVLADLGHLFLGSRLKRLAERLQADAAKVNKAMGVDAQPAELALLAAIDQLGPLTISAAVESLGVSQPAVSRTATGLVDRGLLTTESDEADQRQKTLKLTRSGRALVAKAKEAAWPFIAEAVRAMCAPLEGTLLEQLTALEGQLNERPLETRALDIAKSHRDTLAIRDYSDDLAQSFYEINAEWISSMFTLEKKDIEILKNPRKTILDDGGFILFVESAELGVVGTCAVMKVDDGVYELTKMGVLESARGRKAGELLLQTALARADAMKIDTLYLLTNSKCAPAIRLYEKLGFVHDKAIMKKYGAAYARCNVAMRYRAT
ncbi:Transcriptional regulator, MarR family [Labilithrix luteola]|uniref:Transcriptional regulator, MarR family n=1 Tax=Labilithrix luteola TaxID=1391654 RepID=A0A0K1PNB7_9BACT|nr:bifunctional helix-turn-helix transcriptional regulator/GNAT family N-acetyltransferase [Labilithrix luteola]AKU94886.1 Transcriptional regulator, MarR family [Labilithrix luteola]